MCPRRTRTVSVDGADNLTFRIMNAQNAQGDDHRPARSRHQRVAASESLEVRSIASQYVSAPTRASSETY
eukprot:27774-Eustigmatos_ZCMA.PRE.1